MVAFFVMKCADDGIFAIATEEQPASWRRFPTKISSERKIFIDGLVTRVNKSRQENSLWRKTTKLNAMKKGSRTFKATVTSKLQLAAIGALAAAGMLKSHAAPIIDDFSNSSMLSASAGSAIIDVSSGDLVVTPAETSPGVWGAFGGQAIFVWSLDGGKYSGFSASLEDDQYILSLSGIQNVTPSGSTDAFLYGYIYLFTGTLYPSQYFDVNPVGGNWSINVYDVALNALGSVPADLKWSVELYSASGGQEGVGYQFSSFAAVPEPGTFGMLIIAGAVALATQRRRSHPAS
jgi:hypothetical protein